MRCFKGGAVIISVMFVLIFASFVFGVNSKVVRQSTQADFKKGKTENVVIGSQGNISLSRSSEFLVEEFDDDVWVINCIVVDDAGAVYLGTSPNGAIFKYKNGKLTKIYPLETEQEAEAVSESAGEANDLDVIEELEDVNDPNIVKSEEHLSNEHIFAMAIDSNGRLLAGVSGEDCRLVRFSRGEAETIFEVNDVDYIFAIARDQAGNIYLGTGSEGKIYRLNPAGKKAEEVYDSQDKNILSLALGRDGFLYAGSDERGLVYKIDPDKQNGTVVYDSDQQEITSLLADGEGNLYAAATSARIVKSATKFARPVRAEPAGKPEAVSGHKQSQTNGGSLTLTIANTNKKDEAKKEKPKSARGKSVGAASFVYKIDADGFVTDIFSKALVLFWLGLEREQLLVGTGNNAELFGINLATEEVGILYQDKQASQITSVYTGDKNTYLGTANPAKLIRLSADIASEGDFISDLIDAGQPAKWGKLQIDAEIPQGSKVLLSARSGNVKDVNDPTFSAWTKPVELTEPTDLKCPLGRFCQYKLILKASKERNGPVVRQVAVAYVIPNLAPRVKSVSVARLEAKEKAGKFKIQYKASDKNQDKLIYRIEFRKLGRKGWIELKDELEKDNFEWDGRTVEDGRYEVRITASDEKSNTTMTKLSATRMSDPVVIDNTAPAIEKDSVKIKNGTAIIKLKVADELSMISKLVYTVDSNSDWIGTLPDDLIYDTTRENFVIVIEDMEAGEHVVAVKISDAVGNTFYKTFDINIK